MVTVGKGTQGVADDVKGPESFIDETSRSVSMDFPETKAKLPRTVLRN